GRGAVGGGARGGVVAAVDPAVGLDALDQRRCRLGGGDVRVVPALRGQRAGVDMNDVFCSEAARAERAPLAGTATRADAWLLVEHYGAWGERAVEQNDLPEAVREWMQAQVAALKPVVGKVRPLLVRREEERPR